ncbi:MAG: sugar ABC transporter substrate-binding protein [Anaerolineae bacterium]|nr:sugar ABC transporter substrate-binding protein [Anaerolineae bacterium]
MKAKLIALGVLVALLVGLVGCPAPTPQIIEKEVVVEKPVIETVIVEKEVVVTPAPPKEEKVLRILSLAWPQTPVEQEFANEYFTPKTGIKVEITGPPYEFVESKVREICASKSSEYDLFEYDSQWYGGAVMNGCFEPLDSYFEKDGLDYNSMFVQPYATYNGRWPVPVSVLTGVEDWRDYTDVPLYFIPWTIGTMILSYQPALFVEAGIVDAEGKAKPPETWEEMLDAAKKLTVDIDGDGKIDRYGLGWYACRISDGVTQQWLPFHISYGAAFWDEKNWQAKGIINSPEAVEGCEMFTRFYKEGVVDPATATWFVSEILGAAFTDKFAMSFTWVSFAGAYDDPAVSQTAGKWAYAPFPCHVKPDGTKKCAATYGSQGMGINAFSKQKEAAWEYMKWYMSPEIQKMLVDDKRAGFASARVDLFDYQMIPGTAKWASLKSVTEGWAYDVWTYPEYAQLLDIQQNYMNLAYIGQIGCKEALDQIATLHQRILDTSPNNPKNK